MKSKVQLQRLVILGMMALFSIPTRIEEEGEELNF